MTTERTAEERANIRFLDPLIAQHGDEEWAEAHSSDMRFGFATCIREEVEPLEELVQKLVDAASGEIDDNCDCDFCARVKNAIASAKELGFVRTNTTEP
jgi:hypothetical protein